VSEKIGNFIVEGGNISAARSAKQKKYISMKVPLQYPLDSVIKRPGLGPPPLSPAPPTDHFHSDDWTSGSFIAGIYSSSIATAGGSSTTAETVGGSMQ
jgi:hypothetical protein